MTIREYIESRRPTFKQYFFFWAAVLIISIPLNSYIGTVVILCAAWVALILFERARMKCPKCAQTVRRVDYSVKTCPRCGVNFDQPMESVAGP
jgi:hypothetical protein